MDAKQAAAEMMNVLAAVEGLPAQFQTMRYVVYAFLKSHPAYSLFLSTRLLEIIDLAVKGAPTEEDNTPHIIV